MVLLPSGDTAPLHTASTRTVAISLGPTHVARPMRHQQLPTATTAASGSTSVRPSANSTRWQIHTNHEGTRHVTPSLIANRLPTQTRGLGGVPRHLPDSATTTTHLHRLTTPHVRCVRATIRRPRSVTTPHLCDPVLTALFGRSTPIMREPDTSLFVWLQTGSPLGCASTRHTSTYRVNLHNIKASPKPYTNDSAYR
jgi:hypothetical protein